MQETPVLIVGGGPVGMMLALELDRLGVRSVLVNSEPTSRWLPKGSTQNARTMEHYRRLGIVGRIRRSGLPSDYPTDVGYFTRFAGFELARIAMPTERQKQQAIAQSDAAHQTPEPIFRSNQMYVERLLFGHLGTRPRVTMRYGWTCTDWAERGGGIEAEIESAEGGRERWRARFIVGCDGGRSIVRRNLGIHYDGETLNQAYLGGPMVNTHLRARDFYARVGAPTCWQYWAVNAEVRSNLVALDGKDEFVFSTKLRSFDDKPDGALIARQFRASVGADLDVEFLGHSTWTGGQAYVAERFGAGRALLAGDAVHLFTPTGGFGMNTGVDDAANLAWKLAAMLEGWGGQRLVASYETERRPIARRNTAASQQLARNVGAVPIGTEIEEASAEGVAARGAASAFLANFGEEFASVGVQLGARYDGSPIVVADGTLPPPDDLIAYRPSACPGGRAPHVFLADRSSLFDHFARGFTLVRFGGDEADALRLAAAAQHRAVPLTLVAVAEPAARELYERNFALVRPDQHIAWRGDRVPDDCDGLLARVTGW
jgi:2-polyprenyl-6-methoxyphenol hydroxylase-like FAD-dependent oxidoreductase